MSVKSTFDKYKLNYWYNAQIRRYNMIFSRIFANLQYAYDIDENGEPLLRRVPVRFALKDNMVAYLLKNANENALLSVPMFTINLADLSYDRSRVVDPLYSEQLSFDEKIYDEEKNSYINKVKQKFTVERYSPVPYTMKWEVHLWTSNTSQKEQLVEQLIVLFNPSIQLQFSDNPLDWTSLTEVSLEEINYSNNSIPVGSKSEIEITTFVFSAPVWFSPPAIVETQKIIETIVTNITDTIKFEENLAKHSYGVVWTQYDLLAQDVVTPGNHSIIIDGDSIFLADEGGSTVDSEGNPYSWNDLFSLYGEFRPNTSMIFINPTQNIEEDLESWIKGTIIGYGSSENELIWSIDPTSIPQNTIEPINAVIDPTKTFPNNGLPSPSTGQRYLLLNDIGPSSAWGSVSAKKHDIIEFDGTTWKISFSGELETNRIHYVWNLYTNKQLKWNGKEWTYSIDGKYDKGWWKIGL